MYEITLDEIVERLWEIYKVKQLPITKADLKDAGLPSYNACMNRGLRLYKLNAGFTRKLYYENPRKCRHCQAVISYEKRINEFCSRSCAVSVNNKTTKSRKIKQECECLNCGKIFFPLRNSTSKYCSQKCAAEKKVEDNFLDWYLHGKSFVNRVLKNFLTIVHGYKCSVCGLSDWNGKDIVLEVEHIDGNSENASPDNVCLICPNCHSQTDTYKGKNIGNGRHNRRIRYQEGKSY